MLADGDYKVGEFAKCFYPTDVEISSPNNAEAEAQTLELLKQDKMELLEPAIRFEDLFVRAEILMDDSWRKYATFH